MVNLKTLYLPSYIHSPINVQLCIFIAFLRKERTHPKFILQAQEIEIFFVKTANWPPLLLFSGARFRVH